jgi:hypothetical protein
MSAQTKCDGALNDCEGLKDVLGYMFNAGECKLILNKSHGGSSDAESGTFRQLYVKVPEKVIVIEVGSPGYSNWGHAIPWVMEVIRLIKDNWGVGPVFGCDQLKWAVVAAGESERARVAWVDLNEGGEGGEATVEWERKRERERVRYNTPYPHITKLLEQMAGDDDDTKLKQIIQLVLANTRFYGEGCEIYNMSFAGSLDGVTPDHDAYIYNLGASDKEAHWIKHEFCQYKTYRLGEETSERGQYTDARAKAAFSDLIYNTNVPLDPEDAAARNYSWDATLPGGRAAAQPLVVPEHRYQSWGGNRGGGVSEQQQQQLRRRCSLFPSPKNSAWDDCEENGKIITMEDLDAETALRIGGRCIDYEYLFTEVTKVPIHGECFVIFTISCKPYRDGYEILQKRHFTDMAAPEPYPWREFSLWIDVLIHGKHTQQGNRCAMRCGVLDISSDLIHDITGKTEANEIKKVAADLLDEWKHSPQKMLQEAVQLQSRPEISSEFEIAHYFENIRDSLPFPFPQDWTTILETLSQDHNPYGNIKIWFSKYWEGTDIDTAGLKSRFEKFIEELDCPARYPCEDNYNGYLSTIIRNIKKHLQGCLCTLCGCGQKNSRCGGEKCPSRMSGGNSGGGRIAYKRKSKRRTYKKRTSKRSRRRPNKKRKKRTRRRTKRKTRRNKNK